MARKGISGLVTVFLVFGACTAFAQGSDMVYAPAPAAEGAVDLLKGEREYLRKLLLPYVAVRKNDLSMCQEFIDTDGLVSEACQEDIQVIQHLRCVRDGACSDNMPWPELSFKRVHQMLGMQCRLANNATQLDVLFCQALQTPNRTALNTMNTAAAHLGTDTDNDIKDSIFMTAVAAGYSKGADACKRFVIDVIKDNEWSVPYFSIVYGCNILFGQTTLEESESDFLAYAQSMELKDISFCNEILDRDIQDYCVRSLPLFSGY